MNGEQKYYAQAVVTAGEKRLRRIREDKCNSW
jgi:hypothetical protein